jgi:hypothetical protein
MLTTIIEQNEINVQHAPDGHELFVENEVAEIRADTEAIRNLSTATVFDNLYCSKSEVVNGHWPDLLTKLCTVPSYAVKKSAPLIKLALFGDNASGNGSLKHDENLLELLGVEGDYDAEDMSIYGACKLLERHNIRAILYTSWSSSHEKPRWRVLAPTSKATPKEDHCRLVARINGALGGILAGESFTLAQGYFIGRNPNQPYICICTFNDPNAGECIDLLDGLDQIAIGKPASTKNAGANQSINKSGTHEDWLADMLNGHNLNASALRIVGHMVAQGLDDLTIHSVFQAWKAKLIETRGSHRVADLFNGELDRMINGARNKGFAPKVLRQVLLELGELSSSEVRETWFDKVEGLSPADISIALDKVCNIIGIKPKHLRQELAERARKRMQEHRNDAIASRVGERVNILYQPENTAALADIAEAETVKLASDFELAKFAGVLVRVVVEALPLAHDADTDRPPAPTAQTDIMTKAKLLPLVESAVVFQSVNSKGQIDNIAVPDKVLDHILVNYKIIPSISAMITHPVVTSKGRVITASGIDRDTGLLLYGNESLVMPKPYSNAEAKKAIARIKSTFLDGFEFSTKLDEAAALGLLFTAIERKLMTAAPGGLVSAAQQSTGKTTLVKILHVILTGRDLPVMSWPDGNETEVQKALLSTLLRSPELICFDNIGDGLTFKSPTLALAMTSSVFEGRILGLSRDASVPTNVMMTVTGNNIKLANDEVHRWLKVSLTTSNPSPHKRKFKHTDVLKYGLSIRESVLRDVIGIVAGYHNQKKRISPASRFPDWDTLVRQPLIWAGELDIGKVFDENMEQSSEIGARMSLLIALNDKFNGAEFGCRELLGVAGAYTSANHALSDTICEALRALHVKDMGNDLSIGHALGKLVGIPVLVANANPPVTLTLSNRTVKGLKRYKVESKVTP